MRNLLSYRCVQILYHLARRVRRQVGTRVQVVRRRVALPSRLGGVFVVLGYERYYQFMFQFLRLVMSIGAVGLRRRNRVRESISGGSVVSVGLGLRFRGVRGPQVRLVFRFRTSRLSPLTLFRLFLSLGRGVLYLVLIGEGVHVARSPMQVNASRVVTWGRLISITLGSLFRGYCNYVTFFLE